MPHIPRAHLTPPKRVIEQMTAADPKQSPQPRVSGLGMKTISLQTYRPNPRHLIHLFFGHGHS